MAPQGEDSHVTRIVPVTQTELQCFIDNSTPSGKVPPTGEGEGEGKGEGKGEGEGEGKGEGEGEGEER